jgi:hypothetical protein
MDLRARAARKVQHSQMITLKDEPQSLPHSSVSNFRSMGANKEANINAKGDPLLFALCARKMMIE